MKTSKSNTDQKRSLMCILTFIVDLTLVFKIDEINHWL